MNETAAYEALAEQLYELERERDERQERAAVVLDAWAEAIRMDWGSIDGRSCRAQLEEISAFLRGTKDTLTFDDVCVCAAATGRRTGMATCGARCVPASRRKGPPMRDQDPSPPLHPLEWALVITLAAGAGAFIIIACAIAAGHMLGWWV